MRLKNFSVFSYLVCLSVTALGINNYVNISTTPWKVIEEQSLKGISTKLKIFENPSLKTKNWISIEFENQTTQTLQMEYAAYTINCKVYQKKGGKLIKQGKIASRSASEILDQSLDSPFPIMGLAPGVNISSEYPSIIGAVLLSVPKQQSVYVEATIQLQLQLSGTDSFAFNWEAIPFAFEWHRPEPIEFNSLYQNLLQLLQTPSYTNLHHYELLSLLGVPEISEDIPAATLIDALRTRTGKEDGRLAIVYHLNDHFNKEKVVLDYYLELLRNKDRQALEELSKAPDIWDDRFLEPIIDQYQQANLNQMHQIMNLLYSHQNAWVEQKGIPEILSDLILYQYEDIIYAAPEQLNRRELCTAALLLDMLGKTGNYEMVPIICPFLQEQERILDTGLVLDPNSLVLPRPMRVCDNALEALMRLEDMNLIKRYKKAKYQPPYENGEAEIIITRIRDQFILDFQDEVCK